LPQWSLYLEQEVQSFPCRRGCREQSHFASVISISGARSSVISMSSQLSWAKSFCLSHLCIYLEQEVQSFPCHRSCREQSHFASVISIYIWSKKFSHSDYEKSEANMVELASNSSEGRKQFLF
jgi:hypothetical protein